jgi:hypothetical protein
MKQALRNSPCQPSNDLHLWRAALVTYMTSVHLGEYKMNRIARNVSLLALALVLLGATGLQPAYADNLYASIRGTVTDPSGAAVGGAVVTATNVDTGIASKETTNSTGSYVFPQLQIGHYRMSVAAANFKTAEVANITLELGQVYALNAKLEIGAVSEAIQVEANPVQVETTSMQLGTVVTGNQIVDMPLNGRNWTQLMQLEPGVQAGSDRFGLSGTQGGYSTNGAETQQNSFLINGTDSNDTVLNVPLVIPSPDAIGEFDLVTSTINPEYGRNSGAIVNATIKSGTNQFHGDVFDFYRDTFLDAKAWFALNNQPIPFHQNQFGGTVGGPIVKDRMFFFFSYQGTRNRSPEGYANGTIPIVFTGTGAVGAAGTTGQRGGDFSAFPAFTPPVYGLSPFPMYGDSASSCPVSGGAMCAAGTPYVGTGGLFNTNTIPVQDFNQLAVKVANQFIPEANTGTNEYAFNPLNINKVNQYLGRIDEKISDKDSVWFYGLYQGYPLFQQTLPFGGSSLPGFTANNPATYYEFTPAWNHTFTPTTLNEARFAYLRFNYNDVVPANTINEQQYGFTGITPQVSNYDQLPIMNLTGYFVLGFSQYGPQPRVQNTYQFTDNFSKVWGHHTLKAGFNMDRLQINNPYYPSLNGNYIYNGTGLFSTGNVAADFLLGIPDSYDQGSGTTVRSRAVEYYSYGQDQWQVSPGLTLTLGLAWDIETPYRNLFDNGEIMSAFRPGEQSKIFPSAPVGFVFPGDPGVSIYGGPTIHYGDLAPRFGFAWSPLSSHKLSVRGGIGIYYNRIESETTGQTLGNPPFSVSTTGTGPLNTSPNFGNPYNSVNTIPITVGQSTSPQVCPTCATPSPANPFPFSPPAPGSSPNFAAFEPLGYYTTVEDPRMTAPRSTNFNLNVQYQIDKATVMTIGYVGTIARHLEGAYNLNAAGQAPGINPVAAAAGCTDSNVWYVPACAATFPYNPAVYGNIGIQTTDLSSNYNSLQASVNRRFSNGLQFQASYTWSRYFDYTSSLENSAFNGPGFNALNFAQNYGPSANDAPQRLVASWTYVLPFYKFGHHWKRLTDDWQLNGIATFQSGFPVAVYSVMGWDDQQSVYGFYAPPDRSDLTGQPLNINHNPRPALASNNAADWVNPAAFTYNAPGTVGSANRNPFYGPGLNFWDMSLEKDIHLTESKYIQLRFETFDTFNHANFGSPYSYIGIPQYGLPFGQILGTAPITTNGDGRVVQLAGKFYF